MSKWPGATRKLAPYIVPALLIVAGLLMVALSVVQGGRGMIIEMNGWNFRADAVAVVYLPESPTARPERVEIRADGEDYILEGAPAIQFLEQWAKYKRLHNERFYNECQTAAGL